MGLAALSALVPATPSAAGWFVAQMAVAQVLLAGVITVRSAIWRSNYPVEVRGQITARLQALRSVVGIVTVQIAAALCDQHPAAFRFVFPVAATFGLIGVLLLRQVRIRGERSELRRARAAQEGRGPRSSTLVRYRLRELASPVTAFGQMFRILRADRRFSQYCIAQSLQGAANLMTIPVVVAVVTRDLEPDGERAFWISTGLIVALPILAVLGSLSRWGRLFDGVGDDLHGLELAKR